MGSCKTDIVDKGSYYELKADMPGFEKQDIHLDVEGDQLTIRAEHSNHHEDQQNQYVRQERSYSSVARSFNIADIKANEISASYERGVLTLTLPKKKDPPEQSRRITIE